MKLTKQLLFVALILLVAAACTKPTNNTTDEKPVPPSISLNNRPSACKLGESVTISVTVDAGSGTVAANGVTLVWRDGTDHSETMKSATAGEYTASFTPTKEGKVTYYATVTNSEDNSATSATGSLTVSKEAVIVVSDATELRLTEIGTLSLNKFIEIYNPSEGKISLAGVELFKNGELMYTFTSAQFIGSGNYGVLFAKGTTPSPGTFQNLGTTDVGISGTKALLIELRYTDPDTGEISTVDAFANTANPDVPNSLWDGPSETVEAYNFFRKDSPAGTQDGWFWTNISSTPGKANTTEGTRLKHQYFKADAVPDGPYLANLRLNPGSSIPQGITAGQNTIGVGAYTDEYSTLSSVKLSVGGATVDMTPSGDGFTYTASLPFSGQTATITIEAQNAQPTGEVLSAEVMVFPAGTTFDEQKCVMLNEIDTKAESIELYNSSSKPVSLVGMYIRKNKDKIFTIPSNMVLKGGGYAVLGFKDNDFSNTNPDLYLGTISNGLSGKKSLLVDLRDADKNDLDLFSNVSASGGTPSRYAEWDMTGAQYIEREIDVVGRHPDAGLSNTAWYQLDAATPGKTNQTATRGTQMKNQVPKINGID
jgi:hypothetical protein